MHTPHTFAPPSDLQHALHTALEYRKGGRPAEAAALYRQLLTRFPQHAAVLGQLADLLMQQSDFGAALPLLEQARRTAPGDAQFWLMEAQCLLGLGRAKDAKKLISEAISRGLRHPLADELLRQARAGSKKLPARPVPLNETLRELDALLRAERYGEVEALAEDALRRHAKSAQVWYLRGMAALLQGRLQDAVAPLKRTVGIDPRMAPAYFNLGFAFDGLGRLDDALQAYRKAVAANPQLVEAFNNLGNVLNKLQRHEEALSAYERAVALCPDVAEYQVNRGDALRLLERFDEAKSAFEAATRLKPDFPAGYANLGFALHKLGRNEEAVEVFARAIDLKPDYFEAHQGMGHTMRRLDRHEDAVEAYRRAAELRPDDPVAHKDLGVEFRELARYKAAIAALQRALELKPGYEMALSLLAVTQLDAGRAAEAFETYRRGLALAPDGWFDLHSNYLLALNYQAAATPENLLAEACAFGEMVARRAVPFAHYDNTPDPDQRLRVGLVSGDFGQHPVGFFLQDVIESLDGDKIELYAYATTERNDALTERLRRSIPHWRDATLASMTDEALAKQIRADGVDILLDLSGHTGHNRLPVFALKPAPIQVSWLGYLGTTGVEAIDYILADPWALPPGEEGQFTETPWRLPETYLCYSPPNLPVDAGPLPALGNGCITFGCFNNLNKINDHVVTCWARVLEAVPDARLFLKSKNLGADDVREKLVARFARHGISAQRLRLDGTFASHEEHFAAYRQVDIALDPFPYPGITTTVEALWMGVPVLSMEGRRFISHQGETILHNLGLPQWIADNEDDYVAKAAAFAADVDALAELRAGLRERLLASPLCDAPRFARHFEAALRGMWQAWCAKQTPTGEAGEGH